MAYDARQNWDDDEYSSSSHSEDSPILPNRHEKIRRRYERERPKRSTFRILAKFFCISTSMILFFTLMYIPVYYKTGQMMKATPVAGWSSQTNRDTKLYILPENVTTVHDIENICDNNRLFLLIIVCSATANFEQRSAIRNSFGNYKYYAKNSLALSKVRYKYKDYNYTHDLSNDTYRSSKKVKRDASSYGKVIKALTEALKNNLIEHKNIVKQDVEQTEDNPYFNDDKGEWGMNNDDDDDDDYVNNVMRIPPKGENDDEINTVNVMEELKYSNIFSKLNTKADIESNTDVDDNLDYNVKEPDYKVIFLLGLPQLDNDTFYLDIQGKIDEESHMYGDIVQEGFIDSYNNLTLKSIMMLKWFNQKCSDKVRYVLKTDDDTFVNVPNLMLHILNRSEQFDAKMSTDGKREYLLLGDLFCGSKPVLDATNKWYSPKYMYGGTKYPNYLSGSGYLFSSATAHALYQAALSTNYFHLEDIYITGMLPLRATPIIRPQDEPGFSYMHWNEDVCLAHKQFTTHRVVASQMDSIISQLGDEASVDRCERIRLTEVSRKPHKLYVIYNYLRLTLSHEEKCE